MNKLKVIRQTLNILNNNIYLLHIFLYDKKYKDWDLVTTYSGYRDVENISWCIANGLTEYGSDEFEVNYSSESFDCECCGFYTVSTTAISKNDTSIDIVEDNHLGYGTRGWNDDEIIEDWKLFGYDVEIEDYKEELKCM